MEFLTTRGGTNSFEQRFDVLLLLIMSTQSVHVKCKYLQFKNERKIRFFFFLFKSVVQIVTEHVRIRSTLIISLIIKWFVLKNQRDHSAIDKILRGVLPIVSGTLRRLVLFRSFSRVVRIMLELESF